MSCWSVTYTSYEVCLCMLPYMYNTSVSSFGATPLPGFLSLAVLQGSGNEAKMVSLTSLTQASNHFIEILSLSFSNCEPKAHLKSLGVYPITTPAYNDSTISRPSRPPVLSLLLYQQTRRYSYCTRYMVEEGREQG